MLKNMNRGCIIALFFIMAKSSAQVFLTEPSDQTVPRDSTAAISFECEANVNSGVYKWRKDGSPLEISGRFKLLVGTLTISSPQTSDAGKYQCEVMSDEGTVVSNYGVLSFAYVDDFTSPPKTTVRTNQGNGISINCPSISYSPTFSLVYFWWAVNKMEVIKPPGNSTHYISQKDGTLYLANPVVTDSDTLQCGTKTIWELDGAKQTKQSLPIKLTVDTADADMKPEFLVKLPSTTYALRGSGVLLECFAGGKPTPQISWSRLDANMPVNHTITPAGQLVLTNVDDASAGVYSCEAANKLASVSAKGEVQVQYAPYWTEEITSSTADISTTATWRCGAKGNPSPNYSWLKDGNKLSSNDRVSITNTQDASELHVHNVGNTDAGMYQCVATNDYGSVFSSGHMTVQSQPPQWVQKVPSVTNVAIGSDATIVCEVFAAPPATYAWTKDDILIENSQRYTIEDSGSLVVRNVSRGQHDAKFTCFAWNSLGNISSFGYLQAYEPTLLTQHPEDATAVAGDSLKLTCKESHDSNLKLSWSWDQDGTNVDSSDEHYYKAGGELQLLNVGSEQRGTYTCCAITDVGTACGSASVFVYAPPDPPTNVGVASSKETSQLVTWSAANDNGAPVTSYNVEMKNEPDGEWTFVGNVNATEYEVHGLLPFNGYSYRVYANNDYGQGKASEKSVPVVTLSGAPTIAPDGVTGGGGEIGELLVKWEPLPLKYYGAPTITYVVAVRKQVPAPPAHMPVYPEATATTTTSTTSSPWTEKAVHGGENSQVTFTVDGSKAFVPYDVKIRADNSQGQGPFSEIATVHTYELPPEVAPSGFRKDWSEAYQAEISWQPVQNQNGYTKGYDVSVCAVIQNPNCVWHALVNLTTESKEPKILVKDLQANSNYKLKAAAFNTAGLGPWSEFADFIFVTSRPPPKNPPTGVKITVLDAKLTLSWEAPEKVPTEPPILGYKVEYWMMNDTYTNAETYVTGQMQATVNIPKKADYYVWVRAYNEGGSGTPSAYQAFSTQKSTAAGRGGDASIVSWSPALKLMTLTSVVMSWLWRN